MKNISEASPGIHFSRNMSLSAGTPKLKTQGDRVEIFIWNMKVMDLFAACDRPNEPSRIVLIMNINIRGCHLHPENQHTQTDSRFSQN